MADPGSWALIAIAAAGAGASAYSSHQSAEAGRYAANLERVQHEDQSKLAEIQGLDEESDRARRLNNVLATNRATATAIGINTDGSRSFLAVQNASVAEADRDIGRIRLNAKGVGSGYDLAAQQAQMSGKAATRTGRMGVGTSLLQGASNAGQIYTK